ncbi:hypothetical protein D3C85_626970 [compost metagenome]
MIRLDVNTSAMIGLTNRLNNLHRSAFPSAVRNSLNEVAFDAKKNVPQIANENFTIRQKNLFNRFTIVDKAKGFNVNNMVSRIGLDGSKQKKLTDGLATQETGGTIVGRKLIAHDMARTSSSPNKKVKTKNYLKNITNIDRRRGSKYFTIKKGNRETVFERVSKSKIVPIYNKRQNRNTRVQAKPFIAPSATKASLNMGRIYQKQAEYQFRKYLR